MCQPPLPFHGTTRKFGEGAIPLCQFAQLAGVFQGRVLSTPEGRLSGVPSL